MLKQTYNVNKKLLTYALGHYNCTFILSIAIEAKLQILRSYLNKEWPTMTYNDPQWSTMIYNDLQWPNEGTWKYA